LTFKYYVSGWLPRYNNVLQIVLAPYNISSITIIQSRMRMIQHVQYITNTSTLYYVIELSLRWDITDDITGPERYYSPGWFFHSFECMLRPHWDILPWIWKLVIGGVISKLVNIKQGNILCKLLCSHLNTPKSTYLFPINGVR
jgi:hypothetical protein